jgi:hypothetical protein
LRSVNLGVRLLCELALLVALAVWGFHAGSGLAGDLVLGLGAPLLAAVVWGLWVAPASRRRLADPARLLVEVLLFAAGMVALAALFGLVATRPWGRRAGIVLAAVVFSHWLLDLIVHRGDLPILPGNARRPAPPRVRIVEDADSLHPGRVGPGRGRSLAVLASCGSDLDR